MFFSPPDSSVHGFLRQEYWSGLPFPSPGNLPDPGIEPRSLNCGQILYHLSHQRSSLRLNELLGWNTHPIGLVSSWSETPENSLCVSVSFPLSLFPTSHPVWGLMEKPAWEERVLTRTSPSWHPDLGLLAPRLWGNKFLLFISQSLLYSFMAFFFFNILFIYFWLCWVSIAALL